MGNEGEGEEVGEVGVGHFEGLVLRGGRGSLYLKLRLCMLRDLFEGRGGGLVHIIQHQLGFIQVIRPTLKSGDAQRFCSLTAGMAMAGGVCVVDCDCVFVVQGADLPL